MKKRVPRLVSAAALAALLAVLAPAATAEEGPFNFYWWIAQYFAGTRIDLFAPQGATVWFRKSDGVETGPVEVPPAEIRSVLLSDLAVPGLGGDTRYTYYLEARSDRDLWITAHNPRNGLTAEQYLSKPQRSFSKVWYQGHAGSHSSDDRWGLYAPETATVLLEFLATNLDGSGTRAITFRGYKFINPWADYGWNTHYSLRASGDTPFALTVFDQAGTGDYSPNLLLSISSVASLATNYTWRNEISAMNAYMPAGGEIRAFRPDGTEVAVETYPAVVGAIRTIAFETEPLRFVGSSPFAFYHAIPRTDEATLSGATFFGFDPDSATLVVAAGAAAPAVVTVSEARTPEVSTTFTVAPGDSLVRRISALGLGLAGDSPFLLSVEATPAVFMTVQVDQMGGFLRPYPLWRAPAASDFSSCFRIKVPQTGKRVGGNVLHIVADVCHETGSPVAARRAIAEARFQYRLPGATTWTEIPSMHAGYPNPDPDRPWHIHWDVTSLPETTVHLRAVATDTAGRVDPYPQEITIVVDRANPEIRSERTNGGGARVEAVAEAGRAVDASVGDAAGRTLLVSLPAGAVSGDDVLLAEILPPDAPDLDTGFPPGVAAVGEARAIRLGSGASALGAKADLILSYADGDGDGAVDGTDVAAETLRGYYRAPGGSWEAVETVGVDTGAREVHLRTDHFTLFALAGEDGSAGRFAAGACLLSRIGAAAGLLPAMRRWRDGLLSVGPGRLAARLYYRLSSIA